ncbi:MAG TPA: hypothetical protein PLY45_02850, partial [bacterium]|nr:hypothetical protein [bacterium]
MTVSGLRGGAKALVISEIARRHPSRALLVLASSPERAQELIDDCSFFLHPDDRKRLALFPESSALPYSRLSPEPEAQADRIEVLYRLLRGEAVIAVAPAAAAMRKTPPKIFISNGARAIRLKETLDPMELAEYLTAYGYEDVGLVEDEGSFARRGGIIDLWPPTASWPVRIELDGERVASMRSFDPASQRSKGDVREISVIPAGDIPFDEGSRTAAAHRIRGRAEEADLPSRERRAVLEALREGISFAGIETFLPLFHGETATIFEYLPADAVAIVDEDADLRASAEAFFREIEEAREATASPERIVRPDEISLIPAELAMELRRFALMRWNAVEEG